MVTGVCAAVAGLFFLCTDGRWQFNRGDILAAICAVCVALHLLLTGLYSRRGGNDVYWLTTIQIGTVALLSCATAYWRHQPLLKVHPATIGAILICAMFATVFAFLVQTAMQRFISPSHTALIFCAEPVFAALYAYWAADERLGASGLLGALLILAGMMIAELWPARNITAIDLSGCPVKEPDQNATPRSSVL